MDTFSGMMDTYMDT